MAAFADLVRFIPTLGGTTDFIYSSAVGGCQSPALANVQNGVKYKLYAVSNDLTQWEVFEGAYNSGTTTFPRTTVLYNSSGTGSAAGQSGAGTKINFTTVPQVAIVGIAEDLISPATHRSYLAGLTLSTAGSSATFSVAAGVAVDSGNTDVMTLAASIGKTTGAWVVGTGNGSFDGTGAAPSATAGWYHVHLIKRPDTGVVDILTSNSATAPTLPAGYTVFRRIGSLKTNGSFQWISFSQNGDDFLWTTPVNDVNAASPGTTSTNYTISVPTGVKVDAKLHVSYSNTSLGGTGALISAIDSGIQVAGTPVLNVNAYANVANQFSIGDVVVRTNTSAQVQAVCGTPTTTEVFITTYGWIDRRGRDA